MRIAEIFDSIQGEGAFAGEPSSFVRTSGCNLRCWFCDTPYTSWAPEGDAFPWQEVADQVCRFDSRHVVVTGGEPMLQPEVVPLTIELKARGKFVTIDTAGTIFRPVHADLMSISPKLSNSTPTGEWKIRHNETRHQPDVIRKLMAEFDYQFKFVIDQPTDVDEVIAYLSEFPECDSSRVFLMPQARTRNELSERTAWLRPLAEERGYRFSPRLHVERWGNERGR